MRASRKVLQFALLFLIAASTTAEECTTDRKNRLPDQDFGMPLTAEDIMFHTFAPMVFNDKFNDYFRPWRYISTLAKNSGSTIKTDKDKFQINLDVQHFAPEEISVKTLDGYVVVEAKHEEKQDDHGFISRQFLRRYALPKGAEPDSVVSQLSSDGILIITAPRKEVEGNGERVVPITPTGPIRKEAKEQEEKEGTCTSEKSCND